MIQKTTDKVEKILETAEKLFRANGFHATGVDQLAAESGITKRTLYKHFGSKEGLIEAVLRRNHDQTMEHIRSRVAETEVGSGKQLLVCFDLYQDWFSQPSFAGCIFIKTLNEFQQCSEKLFTLAAQAKTELRDYFAELANKAGVGNPQRLATELQLILEGSIIVAHCNKEDENIKIAKAMAENLINQALKSAG